MRFLLAALALSVAVTSHAAELSRRKFLSEGYSTRGSMVKVAFFDADSTLRVSLSGSVSANNPTDVMILPFVAERIAELNEKGYLVMIVSNQGGVGRQITIETADGALKYATELIAKQNPKAKFHYIDFADKKDEFRKPESGMADLLEKKLKEKGLRIDWKKSFMVGDSAYKKGDTRPDGKEGSHFSNSDRLFAEKLRIPFFEPNDFFGWRCHGIDVFDKAAQVRAYMRKNKERCEEVSELP